MPKLLITGASGYLANALLPIATKWAELIGTVNSANPNDSLVPLVKLDITDELAVLDCIKSIRPDAIIHCAACNPGHNEKLMHPVNTLGAQYIAKAAEHYQCRLVAVSSDTVFDGVKAPFADNAQPSPQAANQYAVSKANGEKAVLKVKPDAIVVRTSLIYGLDAIDRGTEGFVHRLKSGEPLRLFHDVLRQPVYDKALAKGLCRLAFEFPSESGTINLAGSDVLSRLEFAKIMLQYWGVNDDQRIESVSGSEIAGLPMDLRLIQARAQSLGLATPGVAEVCG